MANITPKNYNIHSRLLIESQSTIWNLWFMVDEITIYDLKSLVYCHTGCDPDKWDIELCT